MIRKRCEWVPDIPIYIDYHDQEWGVPEHDDKKLFELLTLEGAQAGLSWLTILKKRENYREAFDYFDVEKVANYNQTKVEELMQNKGIVRNRLKIGSTIKNAKAILEIQKEFGSFDAYIWLFVNGKPKINTWTSLSEIPTKTPESDAMSKDLAKRGFKFTGSTICYAYMQAIGMVNDHITGCFRYQKVNY